MYTHSQNPCRSGSERSITTHNNMDEIQKCKITLSKRSRINGMNFTYIIYEMRQHYSEVRMALTLPQG